MSDLPTKTAPAAARHVSPGGEEFEIAGRAGPVELMGAPPIPAEARAELLVLKSGAAFLCARPDGDISGVSPSGEGFYAQDTRYLSELAVSFGAAMPVLLAHSVETGYRAVVNATNPALTDGQGVPVPQETLNLRRTFVLAERCYCSLLVHNYNPHAVTVPLVLMLAADFADVFELRGVQTRHARGSVMVPKAHDGRVVFGYEGQDGVFRETTVDLEPAPASSVLVGERVHVRWDLELPADGERELLVVVSASAGERLPKRRSLAAVNADLDRAREQWRGQCTHVESDNRLLHSVLEASERDIHALITPADGGQLPAAGIPWYVAPFGRDSLLTAYECMLLNPVLARDTLVVLAHLQAHADEAWRDAEPGKILHELRCGELARAGLIPHTPYYGTVDATPLFVMLAASYYRWTADIETLSALKPSLDAALAWIERYGDRDGDGFVEYERRSPAGLLNQGWKDSESAIPHADGKLAEGPIALAEVQGYVYLAKLRIAELYVALGEEDRARELIKQAQELRAAFNEAFWMPDEGTFALALDGRKRQVASVTSNPGHCLYCEIVDPGKAAQVVERLLAPDMFSGWGVRTLSADSPVYNPMSYHNGSVWPHDNAIIAAGFKRYGHVDGTLRVATALFDVASQARDFRLAELYCGFDRSDASEIVSYPVACMPQAWAAAAPFMLLQSMLSVTARAPERMLAVIEPVLPPWLGRVELHGLRVGEASVSLAFSQNDGVTGFALLAQEGELTVTMAAPPRAPSSGRGVKSVGSGL
jgi:glycogen debranching enzyme